MSPEARAPELEPVENIWQELRATWHSNRVFENDHDIIEAICDAWQRFIAKPETITSTQLNCGSVLISLRPNDRWYQFVLRECLCSIEWSFPRKVD